MTLLPEAFIQSPLFGIALTVVVYVLCELIVDKFELNIVPPFVLACPMIILFIYLQEPYITYDDYENGAGFINFLLGPASGIIVATVTGIVSIFVCGKIFGASDQVLLSMIPKSVTTPIAMDISSAIGGIPALTAACVIFTGMFGATINHKLLEALKIKNNIAIGLSIGASSHGLGTSVCASKSALQLAIGGASIGLTGIATSLLAPVLLPVLDSLF